MFRVRSAPRSRFLYRTAMVAAGLSFLAGCWRVFVAPGWTPGLFWQLVFPLLVLRVALVLYRRSGEA
jgi:hypothetical protein